MNWKNSICLNLTLAKGLSTLHRRTCLTLRAALPYQKLPSIGSPMAKGKGYPSPIGLSNRGWIEEPKKVCARDNVIMLASNPIGDVILYKMESNRIDEGKPMFFNQCFDKGRLKNFVLWFLLNYGESKTVQLVEQLKNVGFQYASKAGISLGIDDLKIPPKKNDLIYEAEKLTQVAVNKYASGEITGVERFQSLIDIWHRTSEFLKQEVINYFEATDILNPVYMMAFSGARGNISQVRQLVGMRGLMADPQGQIIDFPIRSNFREGLTLTEYIISSYGARKGIVDTALRTANAGYLTRRLVDVAQHVIISNFDCGTRRGIFLTNMKEGNKTIHSVSQRIVGRILARDLFKDSDSPNPIKIASRNDEVTLDLAFEIGKYFSKVFVRSALTCETSKQICQLCYGWSLAQGNLVSIGEAVGVVAAQSIGEPGTQLTMRTFHTGGVFSGDVSDQIKAPFDGIVEYEAAIPGTLIRTPEGRIAFLTKVDGYFYVHKPLLDNNLDSNLLSPPIGFAHSEDNSNKKLKESLFSESKKFKIPSLTLLYIKNGQRVYAKEVIAQISTISRKANAAAGLAEEAELTIKSECEGQFYSKSLVLNEKEIGPPLRSARTRTEGAQGAQDELPSTLTEGESNRSETTVFQEDSESIAIDKIYQSWTWGYAWILSGKIYEYKLPSLLNFFPKLGDFMNSKSYISQIEWKLNPSNGHNVFYDIHKRTPGNILNKKNYMPPLPSAPYCLVESRRDPEQIQKGAHQDTIGDSFFTVKNAKKGIGFKSNDSFNETLIRKAQSNSTKKGVSPSGTAQCENVSPMQSSQILFFDLTKILYKKYGYAFQLPEKNQFFKKSKIASLKNLRFLKHSHSHQRCVRCVRLSKNQRFFEERCASRAPSVQAKDLLFFIKSLTMLNTSNTRTLRTEGASASNELPYFLQWFPSKNQTLTGGYVLLETDSAMDSIISQKSHFLHKFNTSFFSPFAEVPPKVEEQKVKNILKAKNFYTKVNSSTFTGVTPKVKISYGDFREENELNTKENPLGSLKLLSTLLNIKKNKNKSPLALASIEYLSIFKEARRAMDGQSIQKGAKLIKTQRVLKERIEALEIKKTEALDSRVLWVSSSFFKIKLSSLTNCKTSLLFNTSKDSPLLYLTQPFVAPCAPSVRVLQKSKIFEKEHFLNKQNALFTPTLRAATPLTSEQEIPTQKDEAPIGQPLSDKKLNFLFFNKKMPMFLQTNRQGNIKGFQKYNPLLDGVESNRSLPWGPANKHIQNPLETEGALLKLKVSNFLTLHLPKAGEGFKSHPFKKRSFLTGLHSVSPAEGKGSVQVLENNKTTRTKGTKRINDKKRKLSCFKQFEFANLTTYCRFVNTSLSSLPSFTSLKFKEGLPKSETSKFEVKPQKHIKFPSVLRTRTRTLRTLRTFGASASAQGAQGASSKREEGRVLKERIYFGTFSTFTTLIDNSFLLEANPIETGSKTMKQEKSIQWGIGSNKKRSLFLNPLLDGFVSNYLEKEYKRFNKIQNKEKFYSFINQRLFKLTPCLQIHYIRDNTNRYIKANLLNTLPTLRVKSERKEVKPNWINRGKAKISQSLVFSPSAYGALKKGWVVIPVSSKLELWKLHKKRINPGQVLMDKMIFNTPLLTECFLFNDIFNIENKSLPKSFSFGSSALVTNNKVQHLALAPALPLLDSHPAHLWCDKKRSFLTGANPIGEGQSADEVNGLHWVKNNKSRYFMPSPSSHTSPALTHLPSVLQSPGESIKNNVKIGLFIQPVEEYKKMSNFEFKNYVYESNSNTLKNLCKNIEPFENSNIALTNPIGEAHWICNGSFALLDRTPCFSGNDAKVTRNSNIYKNRSMLKTLLDKKKSISLIQSRVNQSFDSLLNWQKYKYNLYNKQNRTLQPLAKFTKKDFSVFSVALWTERTKVLFDKYLSSLRNFNKAFASSGTSGASRKPKANPIGSKAKKVKKGTNTTKKTGMRSGIQSNLPKEGFNLKKFSQNALYVVSRKPLNLSPFLISFDNFSYENQRFSNLNKEITNQKNSPLVNPFKKQSPIGFSIHRSQSERKGEWIKPFHYQSFQKAKLIKKPLGFLKDRVSLLDKQTLLDTNPSFVEKRRGKGKLNFEKSNKVNLSNRETSTKINTNNPNKGYFNLSLSYQTYMVSYPPISKFDSLLDPSLNKDLNLILNFYLNKTGLRTLRTLRTEGASASASAYSSFNISNKVGELSASKSSQHATLASPSVKGAVVANSFYLNINNLIKNVFESPCFSYNLTYPIDKFTLYKKAKNSGPEGKMQNTQFFYSFPNNSLSGNREEIQSNKPFAQTNYASPFIGEVVYTNKNLLNLPSITKGLKKANLGSLFKAKGYQKNRVPYWIDKIGSSLEKQKPFAKNSKRYLQNPKGFDKSSIFEESKKSLTAVSSKENTLDSLSSEKVQVPPLSYSCMFLTQKDLISFYLPSNNFKQSLNINYGKNYHINDILVKFLNMTENPDSENIIKQLESFVRIASPLSRVAPEGRNEVLAPSVRGEDKTSNRVNTLTKMLSKRKDNFTIKIDKLEAGLPLFSASSFSKTQSINKEIKNLNNKKLNMSLLGDFIMYGDPINNNKSALVPLAPSVRSVEKGEDLRKASEESLAAICANGQIIHYNNKKITLRRGQPIFISPKSILHKNDGEFIDPKTPVITLSYQKLKTGDIIQGIPKVEQFLEARTTKRGRLFRDSLPSLLKALFNRYQSKLPLELAVRQSFYKIQQIIVDGVQRVYKSQGVTIADKHLEVIVKQMTSKVRILDGAQTGFFPGEIVDLNFVEKINKFLIKKITYEPLVLGITRASLEVDSFLSASSFQQTTRILSEAAIYKKKDFLKGLKENVILGNLIPAGTGYLVNQDDIPIGSKI